MDSDPRAPLWVLLMAVAGFGCTEVTAPGEAGPGLDAAASDIDDDHAGDGSSLHDALPSSDTPGPNDATSDDSSAPQADSVADGGDGDTGPEADASEQEDVAEGDTAEEDAAEGDTAEGDAGTPPDVIDPPAPTTAVLLNHVMFSGAPMSASTSGGGTITLRMLPSFPHGLSKSGSLTFGPVRPVGGP